VENSFTNADRAGAGVGTSSVSAYGSDEAGLSATFTRNSSASAPFLAVNFERSRATVAGVPPGALRLMPGNESSVGTVLSLTAGSLVVTSSSSLPSALSKVIVILVPTVGTPPVGGELKSHFTLACVSSSARPFTGAGFGSANAAGFTSGSWRGAGVGVVRLGGSGAGSPLGARVGAIFTSGARVGASVGVMLTRKFEVPYMTVAPSATHSTIRPALRLIVGPRNSAARSAGRRVRYNPYRLSTGQLCRLDRLRGYCRRGNVAQRVN
jgi:hypothetical protein